jgi:hypothetical protein
VDLKKNWNVGDWNRKVVEFFWYLFWTFNTFYKNEIQSSIPRSVENCEQIRMFSRHRIRMFGRIFLLLLLLCRCPSLEDECIEHKHNRNFYNSL